MNLYQARATIITKLTAGLTAGLVNDVRGHRGQFESAKEVKKLAVKHPAVLVAYRGFSDAKKEYGEVTATVQWVVYVLTQDGKKERAEVAGDIVSNLLKLIPGNDWGFANEEPEKLAGRNVTSSDVDQMGVSLWAVSWVQKMAIEDLTTLASLDDLTHVHGEKIVAANEPTAIDDITLPSQ
jgi:Bacteriophage Mu, Gp37